MNIVKTPNYCLRCPWFRGGYASRPKTTTAE